MTATADFTIAERVTEIDAEIANLTAARAKRITDLEDELAAGRDVTAIRKDVARIASSLEIAQATRRGLDRQRLAEEREAHVAGIAEAEVLLSDATAAFEAVVAARDYTASELVRLEQELFRTRTERDNAIIRVGRRRDAFARLGGA